MQYVTPEPVAAPAAPTVDPQIKALQDQLAALTADKTAQAAAARRAELFAPAMDFENVPGIEADQAEAVYNDIMKPQLEKMYGAMEEQLNANKSYYETQISELRESSTAANQTLQQQARAKELTEQSRWVDTNQTIMSVHPSFEKDMQSAEFKAQAGQYYDELVNAYHDHNAEHVNAVMSYVKASGYQSVAESTAGLGASTATTSPVSEADAADEAYSHDKMTEMNELMRLRRIDRKSFLEFSAQYTAHHKAKNA